MTKIDDAAVERMKREISRRFGMSVAEAEAREVLEAALTPQEPEIPVSEGMKEAGANEIKSLGGTNHRAMCHGLHLATYPIETFDAVGIYKAMERVRRKEAGQGPERRTGKDRRVNRRDAWWRSTGPPPWRVRGDEGRGQNRGRRKTDQ